MSLSNFKLLQSVDSTNRLEVDSKIKQLCWTGHISRYRDDNSTKLVVTQNPLGPTKITKSRSKSIETLMTLKQISKTSKSEIEKTRT